jgi:hypothetical protein
MEGSLREVCGLLTEIRNELRALNAMEREGLELGRALSRLRIADVMEWKRANLDTALRNARLAAEREATRTDLDEAVDAVREWLDRPRDDIGKDPT